MISATGWLGILGTIFLMIGLVLAFEEQEQFYPGLVMGAGALMLAACLLVFEWQGSPDR